MTEADRDGLVARIRQVGRLVPSRNPLANQPVDTQSVRIESLEERMRHLEQQLDGLQDSVHRESERHAKLIADLEARVQPGAMGSALAQDARDRGL
jgi:hypothetical protein